MHGRRVYATRARRRNAAGAPPAMRPGPTPRAAVASRGGQQRRRRCSMRARANLIRVMAGLLRLRVLPLSTVSQASDVARLAVLARALRRERLAEETVLGVLVLDYCARSPELTADFIASVQRSGARLRKLAPAKVFSMYTESAARGEWKTFWHGPTRLHLAALIRTASPAALLDVGARLAAADRIRGSAVLSHVRALPHVGPYVAMSMLRAVAAGAGKKLRDCRVAATAMSPNTSLLAEVLPFADAAKELRRVTREQYEEALLAFFYCETTKVLQHESVLEPLSHYHRARGRFAEDLASTRCKRLADSMECMAPVDLDGNSETELLNRVCPEAKRLRHSSTDVVRRWREVKAASV